MENFKAKQALRATMALRKKEYSMTSLSELSFRIMHKIEQTDAFKDASCVALYHAIAGEVETADFIEKWYTKKKLLLPVIEKDILKLVHYTGKENLKPGVFGILEPVNKKGISNPEEVDLIIVPGVAFDRHLNRMGHGKGYYDRLLPTLSARKVGICFGFQLLDKIPTEPFDKPMDCIITENEII